MPFALMNVPGWLKMGIILTVKWVWTRKKRNILLLGDRGREWGKRDEHLAHNSDYSRLHPYPTSSKKNKCPNYIKF